MHYMYMCEYCVQVHKSPIVSRYVDWTITVPLQMTELKLTQKAARKLVTATCSGRRLLLGAVAMLGFGYAGLIGALVAWIGFSFRFIYLRCKVRRAGAGEAPVHRFGTEQVPIDTCAARCMGAGAEEAPAHRFGIVSIDT